METGALYTKITDRSECITDALYEMGVMKFGTSKYNQDIEHVFVHLNFVTHKKRSLLTYEKVNECS